MTTRVGSLVSLKQISWGKSLLTVLVLNYKMLEEVTPTLKTLLLKGSFRCLKKALDKICGNEVTVGWKWPPMLLLCLSERGVCFLIEVWVSLVTNRDHRTPEICPVASPTGFSWLLLSPVAALHLSHQACMSLLEQKGPQRGTGLTLSINCRTRPSGPKYLYQL